MVWSQPPTSGECMPTLNPFRYHLSPEYEVGGPRPPSVDPPLPPGENPGKFCEGLQKIPQTMCHYKINFWSQIHVICYFPFHFKSEIMENLHKNGCFQEKSFFLWRLRNWGGGGNIVYLCSRHRGGRYFGGMLFEGDISFGGGETFLAQNAGNEKKLIYTQVELGSYFSFSLK